MVFLFRSRESLDHLHAYERLILRFLEYRNTYVLDLLSHSHQNLYRTPVILEHGVVGVLSRNNFPDSDITCGYFLWNVFVAADLL